MSNVIAYQSTLKHLKKEHHVILSKSRPIYLLENLSRKVFNRFFKKKLKIYFWSMSANNSIKNYPSVRKMSKI